MEFESSGTLVHFNDIGADTTVLKDLVGKTYWDRMFPESDRQPSAEDVLPVQLRNIVAHQVRQLASKLSGDDFKTARQSGTEACRAQRMKASAPY